MDGTGKLSGTVHRVCARVLGLVVLIATGSLPYGVGQDASSEKLDSAVEQSLDRATSRRGGLSRFDEAGVHPSWSVRHAAQAACVRPQPRLVDARQSPMVAVVSNVDDRSDNRALSPRPVTAASPSGVTSPATGAVDVTLAAPQPPTVEQALATRGSVTFRKTPISEVVFLLSDLWHINIVAGADVTGDVSGAFQDAPLSEVLSAALTASGYGYRQIGSSLVVLPIDQINGQSAGSGTSAGFTQPGIAYFSPQYTEAEEMAEPLQTALGELVVVAVYPEENRIMVKGSAADLTLAAEAIRQLDVPRPQVRITAMIYDVALEELVRIGFDWNREVRGIANNSNEALADVTQDVSDFFRTTGDLTTSGLTSFGLRTINDELNANVFLQALDANSEAKLLADPSITVADRTEASIRIVQEIPIVGANPVEGSNAVFTQTEFRDAGVILIVKPRISRDGTIQLSVQPEYSVVSEITATGPVIDSRRADTIVRVNNGQMFVLGGLRQKTIVETVRGVPYLKNIKYLGYLFSAHSTEVRESELIVFLKPELVTPFYDGYPRERRAGCVATGELNRIPYAEPFSQIPCCNDPACPNHHPRPRVNGGSYALEMLGGSGLTPADAIMPLPVHGEQVIPESVQLSSPSTVGTEPVPGQPLERAVDSIDESQILEPTTVEELHPPVHIAPKMPDRS